MLRNRRFVVLVSTFLIAGTGASTSFGDEGMWLFNRLPKKQLKERYGFEPSDEWARNVMRSSVRLSSGGSGSLVSPRGLVLTNHHVASTFLHELSTSERNLIKDGFSAKTEAEELKCPNAEFLVLWEIEDVTARVQGAVPAGADSGAALLARRGEIAKIESEAKEKTGLHCEVVTLYRGGEYHLYRYRRYDDIRLVFAPETSIAYFGGDADNFEFPRYCLDMTLLRIYENGKPAKVDHFLRWSAKGAKAGELTFVSGHPGRTQRLNTVDHLRFYRDVTYPNYLQLLYRREVALQQFSLGGEEQKRIARDDLFSIENGRKAIRGMLAGLQDPGIVQRKLFAESTLRGKVALDGSLGATQADWDRIKSSLASMRPYYDEYSYLERGRAFWSDLFSKARQIVRLAEEGEKPGSERLPEYRDSALPRLKQSLLSPAPIEPELEVAKLGDSLTNFAEVFGAEHPLVQTVLDGKAPLDRAYELVHKSTLREVAARKALVDGGKKAVDATKDPMVLIAKAVDPYARAVRKKYETFVRAVQTESYAHISKAAFGVTGTSVYPDATFTLRLAFGEIKGWKEGGEDVPPFTKIGTVFELDERSGGKEPYVLPESWKRAREKISLATPFNFVSTADIIGGNSGSPVINRNAEVVGLIFDGNIHSLVLDFSYTEEKARAVSVDGRAILEVLNSVYGMDRLVKEISGR